MCGPAGSRCVGRVDPSSCGQSVLSRGRSTPSSATDRQHVRSDAAEHRRCVGRPCRPRRDRARLSTADRRAARDPRIALPRRAIGGRDRRGPRDPEGTAKSRLNRALHAMRAALEADARTTPAQPGATGMNASHDIERDLARWMEVVAPSRAPETSRLGSSNEHARCSRVQVGSPASWSLRCRRNFR